MEVTEEELQNMSPEELQEFQKKNCIFCQISSGKIPAKKIYEDGKTIKDKIDGYIKDFYAEGISTELNRTGFVGESIFWETTPMTKLKYTPEIRERAVQLLIESEKDYPSNWAAITAIAPWAVYCARVVLLKHYVFGIKNI